MPSGQDIVPVPIIGCGIRLGTTAVMVSDGMILGGMVHGTDIAACMPGMIPGTMVGMIHIGAHGDGTTTDIPATTAHGIIHIATTVDILTTMVAVVAVTTTDVQVTLELSTRMVVQVIAHIIAILLLIIVRVWAV